MRTARPQPITCLTDPRSGKHAHTFTHTATSQLHNCQLTDASRQASVHPAPVPNGHADTHHTNTPPACPIACPQLHIGISASEKSPTQAAKHPPRSPLSCSRLAKRIGPPPLFLPPVDSSNGLRVLTLSFQTRFPAGLPVPAPLRLPSLCLWPSPSLHRPHLNQESWCPAWPASSPAPLHPPPDPSPSPASPPAFRECFSKPGYCYSLAQHSTLQFPKHFPSSLKPFQMRDRLRGSPRVT